jgi:hypothetical protein
VTRRPRTLPPCLRASVPACLLLLLPACTPVIPRATTTSPAPTAFADSLILSEEQWTFHTRPGRAIETPHFRLYTTLSDSLLLDRFPAFAERALIHYTTYLTDLPEPARRLETFLMATRPQWAEITQRVAGQNAATYLQIQRGGFAYNARAVYWDIGPHDTLAMAAHEGWHQYTQSTFKVPLPIWLEEGLGTYMEGFRWAEDDRTRPLFLPWSNPERFDTLRNLATRNELIPLQDLLTARPQDLIQTSSANTLGYYAQVWALTHFLAETPHYRPALQQMLREHASGRALDTYLTRLGPTEARRTVTLRIGNGALRTWFTTDLEAAASEYREFVQRITEPGARQRIVAGESPLQ